MTDVSLLQGRHEWGDFPQTQTSARSEVLKAFKRLPPNGITAMAGGDFIDLLSSDEETVPALRDLKAAPKPAAKPAAKSVTPDTNLPNEGGLVLPDGSRKVGPFDESHESRPVKRRRTGQSLALSKKKTSWTDDGFAALDDDDPIIFTSSDHQHATVPGMDRKRSRFDDDLDILSDDSHDSLPEDILGLPRKTTNGHLPKKNLSNVSAPVFPDSRKGSSGLSDTTKALLASLRDGNGNGRHKSAIVVKPTLIASGKSTSLERAARSSDTPDTCRGEEDNHTRSRKQEKRSQLTKEEKTQRAEEKEQAKEAKAQEKEQAKEQKAKTKEEDLRRKRNEREEKARRKQKDAEIAEVNKAKLDKKDSTPEMIVDLPASLHGQKIDTQTRESLKNLDVETSLYQSSVPNVVKLRRKMKAKWNAEEGLWEPLLTMQVEDEKHVICIMPAKEFVSLASAQDGDEDIGSHVVKLRNAYPGCVRIYLIEGLSKRMRESKTAANRKYQSQVLNQGQSESTESQQPNKRKKAATAPTIIDEDVIEDALLRLQVMNDCLIHHTAVYVETAEWIATFTQHISTIPYK